MSDNSPLTPEEQKRLEWCLSILDEENLLECQEEAEEIAYKEANESKATTTSCRCWSSSGFTNSTNRRHVASDEGIQSVHRIPG